MPHPSESLATLRPDLSGSLQEFDLQANMMGFVGLRIAPAIEVNKPSGAFGRIPIKELLQNRETARAPGTGYSRGTGKFEPDSYTTQDHGTEEPVDDTEAAMYADYYDAELVATARARDIVLRAHEQRVIALADAVSYTNAAGTAWTSTASATPIVNVRAARIAMRERIGLDPRCMVISWNRFQYLKDCAEIIDRAKAQNNMNVQKGSITAQQIANALDLDEIIIAGSVYNSANEGQAATIASLWTDSRALLFVKPRTRDHREPCWARTFHWGADGSTIGGLIESYRDEGVRSNIIRVRMHTGEKEMYAEAAQVITGI